LKKSLYYAVVGILTGLVFNSLGPNWFPLFAAEPPFGFPQPLAVGIAAYLASYGLFEEDWLYRVMGVAVVVLYAIGGAVSADVPMGMQLLGGLIFALSWVGAGFGSIIVAFLGLGIAGSLFGGYGFTTFLPLRNGGDVEEDDDELNWPYPA
jgi:hypothetical protein